MTDRDPPDSAVYRRIARRVEEILEAARDRERNGQTLALDIDARFRLQDLGAVQFQLASAFLEETSGLRQEQVVTELLTRGLASVLQAVARGAATVLPHSGLPQVPEEVEEVVRREVSAPSPYGRRVLN